MKINEVTSGPVDPDLIAEVKMLMEVAQENGLWKAYGWMHRMWLDYRESTRPGR